ncbi:MAG: MotA/TolQ/ExbB proton channel family protein [Roseococcus sp.]|nr:MotA/TolQ/ExbB proton channel family protein [Roseococcus sp.]
MHDFSLIGLFRQADIVVQSVMVALVLASVIGWAIIIDKSARLSRLRREVEELAHAAREEPDGRALPGVGRGVLAAGASLRFDPDEDRLTRKERLREAMRLSLAEQLRPLEAGLPFLATVGSAGPFIGLFGTVWGIMNSFTAIARSGNTSLSTVAPGIAEALLATAIGLAAAIPAVMAYNRFTVAGGRLRAEGQAAIARLADRMSARDRPANPAGE